LSSTLLGLVGIQNKPSHTTYYCASGRYRKWRCLRLFLTTLGCDIQASVLESMIASGGSLDDSISSLLRRVCPLGFLRCQLAGWHDGQAVWARARS
jgi:hypothetical protein